MLGNESSPSSRDSVRRFLARHGLETAQVRSLPVCRSLHGTLGGLKRFERGPVRLAAVALGAVVPRALGTRVRFWLDAGDIMLVCARKA